MPAELRVLSDPLLVCCYPVALRPKRKPHLAVRTKYIGTVDGTLSGDLENWDRRVKLPAPLLATRTSCLDTIALACQRSTAALASFIEVIFRLRTSQQQPEASVDHAAQRGHRLAAAFDTAPSTVL